MTLKVSVFDSCIKTPRRAESANITLNFSKSIKICGTAFAIIKRNFNTPSFVGGPPALSICSDTIIGLAARRRANRRIRKSSHRFHDINCDFAMLQAQIDEVLFRDQGTVLFSSELHCNVSNYLITMETRQISTVSGILFRSEMTIEQRVLRTGNTRLSAKLLGLLTSRVSFRK